MNTDNASPTTVRIERTIDAPVELVYSTWIEPSHVERWWGPRGFTVHNVVIDARLGGQISYTMRSPEGVGIGCRGEFLEVERNRKLVVRSAPLDDDGNPIVWVVNSTDFIADGKKTKLILTAELEPTDDPVALAMASGMEQGWTQSIEKMVDFAEGDGRVEIVASRLLKAPAELVFSAFSDPANITNWWGPVGFSTTTHSMDFRVGGQWLFTMHGPDGTDYPNKVVYTTIDRVTKIAYDHGTPDDFPMFRAEMRFDALPGGTRVILMLIAPTVESRDYMAGFGAIEGAHDTLSRLAKHLETHA